MEKRPDWDGVISKLKYSGPVFSYRKDSNSVTKYMLGI